jgi:hypothetical protein
MQLPFKTINKHRAVDKSVRVIILARITPCKILASSSAMALEMLVDVSYVAL